jgi:hypothetical protein
VYQKLLNYWYETHQAAFSPKEGFTGGTDICNDHKNCEKLPVKETVETLVTSTFLSADYIELKTDHVWIKLLHIQSTVKYKHHMQVKLEYYCILRKKDKLKSSRLS